MRQVLAAALVLTGALAAGAGATSATAAPAEPAAVTPCAEPPAAEGWALGVERLSDPCTAEVRELGSSWR